MREFNKPVVEFIEYTNEDIVTSSTCNSGMENTGWECEGNVNVTCPNAASRSIS